jgi:hypothetical protein
MRFKKTAIAAASIASMALPLVLTGQAQAAPAVGTIVAGANSSACVSDNNIHPGNNTEPQPFLFLVSCTASNANDQFYATPSSYGPGWYSIVSNDHAASSGSYCISLVPSPSDGEGLELIGCNGTYWQAWKMVCVSGGPELENEQGYAMNDFGGKGNFGDEVVGWHFENPAPRSLIFLGPVNDLGSC